MKHHVEHSARGGVRRAPAVGAFEGLLRDIAGDIIEHVARAVLDTNVMVAALRSDRGASRRLLVAALESRYQTLLSVPLMFEYEAVLTRQEHLDAARLTREEVGTLLDALSSRIQPVLLAFLWRPTLPDPADDMVLETAVNGRADLLVTLNIRHFQKASAKFDIDIVSPAEAVQLLGLRT